MKLMEIAASYMLGNFTAAELPEKVSSLNLDLQEPEAAGALAGMQESSAVADIEAHFIKLLRASNITIDNRKIAAYIMINHYVKKILGNELAPVEGIETIIRQVYDKISDEYRDTKYRGDSLNLEKLMGLYYSFADFFHSGNETRDGHSRNDVIEAINREIVELAKEYDRKYLYAMK